MNQLAHRHSGPLMSPPPNVMSRCCCALACFTRALTCSALWLSTHCNAVGKSLGAKQQKRGFPNRPWTNCPWPRKNPKTGTPYKLHHVCLKAFLRKLACFYPAISLLDSVEPQYVFIGRDAAP